MNLFLRRYAGYVLLFTGYLLISTMLPSAAGPADALGGERIQAPDAGAAVPPSAPRLIANPRRSGPPVPAVAQLSPTVMAPSPAPVGTATAEPIATAEAAATAEPAVVPTPAPTPIPTDRIAIPRIAVNARVVDVGVLPSGEMETAAFAAGRLAGSAQAGEAGNAVIAGHNDIQGEVFRRLPELAAGDEIVLYRGGTPYRYRVQLRTIVREDGATDEQRRENARWMEPTDEPVVTLISCYPYRVDTHRVIVRAQLVRSGQ